MVDPYAAHKCCQDQCATFRLTLTSLTPEVLPRVPSDVQRQWHCCHCAGELVDSTSLGGSLRERIVSFSRNVRERDSLFLAWLLRERDSLY